MWLNVASSVANAANRSANITVVLQNETGAIRSLETPLWQVPFPPQPFSRSLQAIRNVDFSQRVVFPFDA